MRQDQYEKLQALTERLADVVINDADPQSWVGTGKKPDELTQQERGDAYWCRKMAVASISVLIRCENLIGQVQTAGAGTTPPPAADGESEADTHLEAEVKAAQKEAAQLLDELQRGSGKAAFDKRVHGRSTG